MQQIYQAHAVAEEREATLIAKMPAVLMRRPLAAAGFLLLVAILAALYKTIVPDMIAQWSEDPNYSHGFLVPLFSAFLIWRKRRALAALSLDGDWIGLPVLALGAAVLVLGEFAAEFFLMRFSLIVIVVGLVLFHLGRRALRLLAFPLGFLVFMVPLPALVLYAVAFPLQRVAAESAAWGLDALGVPVLVDGNVIHLTAISLGVTEACSGIRSLISLLALSVAWGYLTLRSRWAFAGLVAAAVPITIVANSSRVIMTGLVGQWFGPEYGQGIFHTLSGWAMFVLAFAGLLAAHGLLRFALGRRRAA